VLRHSVALHYLTSQSVGCNRFHDLSARAARWLLMSRERVGTDELHLTHEFLAQMLGVYRPSVTVALGMLEQAGIIGRPRRGMVRILDRRRLEEVSCECFRRVQEQMRVFGAVPDME
ncbi:MAG: helix-turn-helix domain-containing protein, partial [Dehalococcoidia bacterium]